MHRIQDRGKSVLRESRNEAMRVILEVLQGSRKGRSFMFDRHDTFIVGRSQFVHCSMPEDMALSRDNFMVEINPPLCELRDLGSTSGTFVNNQRVDRIRLASGDLIAAGQSVFRVRVDQTPISSSEASSPWSSGSRSEGDGLTAIKCTCCGARHRRISRSPARSRAMPPRWSNGGARPAAPNWRPCPSRCRITRDCVRSVAARWAWSTRRGAT